MKLYIITIDDVNDFQGFHVTPIVKLTRKEARKELASLKRSAKETYKGEYDKEDPADPDKFSIYPDGYWGTSHYDAHIDEVEVPITVFSVVSASINDDTLQSLDVKLFPDKKQALTEMKAQVKAEYRDAKDSGYDEIESETFSDKASVIYPSGDNLQEYHWLISENNV